MKSMTGKIVFSSIAVLLGALLISIYIFYITTGGHSAADGHDHAAHAEAADSHDKHDHAAEKGHDKVAADGHDHAAYAEAADSHDKHDHAAEKGHDHAAEQKKSGEKTSAPADAHDADEVLVKVTPEQRKLIGLRLAAAEAGSLELFIRLDGEFRFNQEKVAKIMPRLPGFVSAVAAKEGDTVAPGAVLASLQSPKLASLYADYNSARELEALGKAEYDMLTTLRQRGAVAEREFLKVKRDYADAAIARRGAERVLRSYGFDPEHDGHAHDAKEQADICTIYKMSAPFGGRVISRDIQPGENFTEDNERVTFVVVDDSVMWLDLKARQEDLPRLKLGQRVVATVGPDYPEYEGNIVYISPVLAENTRSAVVRVLLKNPGSKLKGGMFGVGRVAVGKSGAGVVVARDAVQLIAGETVIFVPDGEDFTPKVVKTGRSDGRNIEILSGLKPGEKYVASGAFELKSILLTSGMDPHAGHGH